MLPAMSARRSAQLAALIAAAALAGGCGASSQQSKTAPSASKTAPSALETAPSGPQVSVSKPPVIAAGSLLMGFSGIGSEAIRTLSPKRAVVLEWRTARPPMQIFNRDGFMLVNSNLASGRVRVATGHYRGLRVAAKGSWTIQIHAAA